MRMSARQLREAGKLWPQTLDNVELTQELQQCDNDKSPISYRMLMDEYKSRLARGIIAS